MRSASAARSRTRASAGSLVRVQSEPCPASAKLCHSVVTPIMPLLRVYVPSLRLVPVRPAALLDRRSDTAGGVGCGYSGDAHSMQTLHDFFVSPEPGARRLTHLLMNNVGAHGTKDPDEARQLFHARYEIIRHCPDALRIRHSSAGF